MKNLWIRSLSGSVYVIVIIASILLGKYYFYSVLLIFNILALFEFYNLFRIKHISPNTFTNIFISIIVFTIILFVKNDIIPENRTYYLFLLPVILFFTELFSEKKDSLISLATSVLGLTYITLPLLLFCLIAGNQQSDDVSSVISGTYILIWTSDTFAYLIGISIGKHKLIPAISPKKTWEGFIGGILFTIIAGYILSYFFDDLNKIQWIILGFLVSVSSTIGDLIESGFKRDAGVKDSGRLIPGHGGLLDRIDSLLIVAPVVYIYLNIIKQVL